MRPVDDGRRSLRGERRPSRSRRRCSTRPTRCGCWPRVRSPARTHTPDGCTRCTARSWSPSERGLMLRGVSGAGKSTLTYCCMRGGMGVVSDDWLYGSVAERPRRAHRLSVADDDDDGSGGALPGAARRRGRRPSIGRPLEDPDRSRRSHQQIVQHHVHAVVFIDPDGDLSIEEIDLAQATERFWKSSLPTERDTLAPEWVRRLLDRPRFVLHRGGFARATRPRRFSDWRSACGRALRSCSKCAPSRGPTAHSCARPASCCRDAISIGQQRQIALRPAASRSMAADGDRGRVVPSPRSRRHGRPRCRPSARRTLRPRALRPGPAS